MDSHFIILTGSGLAITSISMNETFCATGSEDGFLRLWPLDFAHVYLEAGEKIVVVGPVKKHPIGICMLCNLVTAWTLVHVLWYCCWLFLTCEDFERMFDNSLPACAFLYFFLVEISLRTLFPLFRPGSVHSGSASWDDCDWLWWVACELVSW